MLLSPGLHSQAYMPTLFDRELSWLAFNRRSLYEVADTRQPVLDRLLKLARTSAALDEYFMVRMPRLIRPTQGPVGASTSNPEPPLRRIRASIRSLLVRQQAHFTCSLKPQLKPLGVHLTDYCSLEDNQRTQLHHQFEDEIAPVLSPLTSPPSAPLPVFSNLSLNLAVCLAVGQELQLSWIKVPRSLSRFVLLKPLPGAADCLVIPLEQVIMAHLPGLFPGAAVQGVFSFRVTRSADLGKLDTIDDNLMDLILAGLEQRQLQGLAVRLEVAEDMPRWIRDRLLDHLQLSQADLYSLPGWLGLSDLQELTRLPCCLKTSNPPLKPVLPGALVPPLLPQLASFRRQALANSSQDFFTLLKQQDMLVHLPYHSFVDTVEAFVAQATMDPSVLTLKMTLYRTAGDAPIVRSLMAAAKAGKQVVVLVELTAFLDEATNIHWAKSLEKAGAHVVYGVVGLKTHTNLILVTRQEATQICQYAYIGTGDYLPNRPQPYADLGLLTGRAEMGRDLSYLFNYLTGCAYQVAYQSLMVAPEKLREQLQQQIEREVEHARAGKPAHLIAKLNLLADPALISALYVASQAGVQIDLIVRGICQLRPGVAGLSDRIRVISLLGKYVEHSRILYCLNDDQPQVWIGTADWTPIGLDESIEVMAPVKAPKLIADIRKQLDYWLADNQHAWILQSDGRYIHRQPLPHESPFSSQKRLMAHMVAASKGR